MGKPGTRHGVSPRPEHIGSVEGTRGIETSQYRVGKESNSDSVSSGERKRKSLNRTGVKPDGVAGAGSWDQKIEHQIDHGVTKLLCRRTVLEKPAVVGNSPVFETHATSVCHPK